MTPGVLQLHFDRPAAVIGDIHGCATALDELLGLVGDRYIIVVGDVGDRGPDTAAVVERLVRVDAHGVIGNHDEWLISWSRGEGFDTFALNPVFGGKATLASYGVQGRSAREVEAQWRRLPPAHRTWLSRLVPAIDLDVCGESYWVVHAGIPGHVDLMGLGSEEVVPMLAQRHPRDLSWTATEPEAMPPLDRTVIFGHQPRRAPLDLGHLVAIDTGAGTFPNGRLTALLLPERQFVSVPAGRI